MCSLRGSEKAADGTSSIRQIIEEISHFLPSQGPIKTFVHHNTLHYFENQEFFDAIDAVNVLLATLGLLGVCAVLTSRFGARGVKTPTGLGAFFPELAVCYLICVLSLVGFPGTLGFIEEEVMMGEGVGHHNVLVSLFAVTLTLNGFSSFRLFARVFYGQPLFGRGPETALLTRERCVIYCIIFLIVLNGALSPRVLRRRNQRRGIISHGIG